jgi:hypothetical protein
MIAHGPGRFQFRRAERHWPSVLVSVAVTVLTFAMAFGAMWSIPGLSYRQRSTPDQVAIVRLPSPTPPPPAVVPRPRPPDRPVDVRRQATEERAVTAPPVTVAPPVIAPVTVPIGIPSSVRDTATAVGNAANDSSGRGQSATRASGKGASIEPAGISLTNRAANTPFVRDSIMKSKMVLIPGLAAVRAPTGREKAELEQSQRDARALRTRALTAGNSRDLVVLQGKGMNGVGAVDPSSTGGLGIGFSIPFTLFSSGPTREQRKKNEIIDADNQLRQRRLQDRMYLKRDSIRADSIRADSIRADSLRRRGNPIPSR